MKKEDVESLVRVRKEDGTEKLYDEFLKHGGLTGAKGIFGTGFVLGDRPVTKQDAPWLQVVLKVSEEAMEELRTIDPLVDSPY